MIFSGTLSKREDKVPILLNTIPPAPLPKNKIKNQIKLKF